MTGILAALPGTLLAPVAGGISHFGTATNSTGTSGATSLSLTFPASITSGDVALIVLTNSANAAISVPSGFTLIASDTTIGTATFYKVCSGSEGGTSVSSSGGAAGTWAGVLSVFRGVHSSVFDATTTTIPSDATADTAITWPAITTASAGAWIVRLAGTRRNATGATGITYTAPSSPAHTIRGQVTTTRSTTARNVAAASMTYVPGTAGTIAAASGSVSIVAFRSTYTIALKPA